MKDKSEHKSYLGAKGGSGVYQAIINLMPPHETYIEGFLGTGAIFKKKAPAEYNIVIDKSPCMVGQFVYPGAEKITGCTIEYLENYQAKPNTLIYLDPPYYLSTRTSNARYEHELTHDDHYRLLTAIKRIDSDMTKIIISGYNNKLYAEILDDWWSKSFQAMTRGGVRTETVWCNFMPGEIHYHTYAGENYTDRQRIKRKAQRWANNYQALPPAERQAVLAALLAVD
ncbi:DNA adenine methylase [Pseudoalteromonas ruthenica]|uniref:DNA adenine methylase n=1 Tax=Pseudoalteromonas ruthenica TaxID=151081 RepID=UPI001246EF1E|nr:DNA adenine methylase [Pseudoalteromonas ruthenica]